MGRLRYSLGGDRPSQTTHLTRSLTRIHESRLELKQNKSGIPLVAPPPLTRQFQCLPPMLYMLCLNPMSSCSEGSRGLSVLLRVTGIFTGITISPSIPSRQCTSRYAIRAGRILPDEEFRYLRTVIVTAAVYRSFGPQLRSAS